MTDQFADGRWLSIGDGVLVRRYAELDLSVGLIIGDDTCLVVDTRGDTEQGTEWAAAVREVTALPWSVVITHAHFDHSFGTGAFLPCAVWAQQHCVTTLAEEAESLRTGWLARYRQQGRVDRVEALSATEVVVPTHIVHERQRLQLGGREVELIGVGPGHTDHDLVVHVPDASVVFAGDLVECAETGSFSADSFGSDTWLAEWPNALAQILRLGASTIVPGHGEPTTGELVAREKNELETISKLRDAVQHGELNLAAALRRSPLPPEATRAALGTPF